MTAYPVAQRVVAPVRLPAVTRLETLVTAAVIALSLNGVVPLVFNPDVTSTSVIRDPVSQPAWLLIFLFTIVVAARFHRELLAAAAESLALTVVIPENHGYQVIHRLQMFRQGHEYGNEFRYRPQGLDLAGEKAAEHQPRADGEYLQVDLVDVARGLGAQAIRAESAADVRAALTETRGRPGPVVIVVPVLPHVDLPGAGVWWDVAPSEVSEDAGVQRLRGEYETDLVQQLWYG